MTQILSFAKIACTAVFMMEIMQLLQLRLEAGPVKIPYLRVENEYRVC